MNGIPRNPQIIDRFGNMWRKKTIDRGMVVTYSPAAATRQIQAMIIGSSYYQTDVNTCAMGVVRKSAKIETRNLSLMDRPQMKHETLKQNLRYLLMNSTHFYTKAPLHT